MLPNPAGKYRPFAPIPMPRRTWPNRMIIEPPIWCAVDLRDGNQALTDPMNADRKQRLFDLLVRRGFRQIEIGFPSASQIDFDFTRTLIEGGHATAEIALQVLVPAREELIDRTFEALSGAPRAIIHLYNSTSPVQRRVVFQKSQKDTIELAVRGAKHILQVMADYPGTDWQLEYSPESFSATEVDFALDICNAVIETWQPAPGRKMIINLPATVEMSTPNVYADQVEYFGGKVIRRDSVILSVHPHNDRGTAVAAAELALMAGAERVEGTLFGNGERTGNVDLITLGLNLYSQGIHPGIDLSDVPELVRVAEYCNRLPVHPRHPYAGEMVFTAFSGSHQDAIRKALRGRTDADLWDVPYLPVDPADLGRLYEPIIRINSQSGKGGVAFVLEEDYGLCPPRRLQVEFSNLIQELADRTGKAVGSRDLWLCFASEYIDRESPYALLDYAERHEDESWRVEATLRHNDVIQTISAVGNGPIDAFVAALSEYGGLALDIRHYSEHAAHSGADARAVAYIELGGGDGPSRFGVGMDTNITMASLKAVISAVNRRLAVAHAASCL